MKKLLGFMAALACVVCFSSCSKEDSKENNEPEKEVTLIGTWTSYYVYELGEFGETVGGEANSNYSVTFTETEATITLDEMSTITTPYEFKENDNTIIYFTSLPDGYQLVGQFKDGEVAIQQGNTYWDYYFYYCFKKQ